MMYSSTVFDHATKPRNRGPLVAATAHGFSAYPQCGDKFHLHLQIVDDQIAEAFFEANACGPVVAAGSLGTELLKGLTVQQARELGAFQLDERLGGLPPSKRHAILLFLDALYEALQAHSNNILKENEVPHASC